MPTPTTDKVFDLTLDGEPVLTVETEVAYEQVRLVDQLAGTDLNLRADQIAHVIDMLLRAQAHLAGKPSDDADLVTMQGSMVLQPEGWVHFDLDYTPKEVPESHKSATANCHYHYAWELLGIDPNPGPPDLTLEALRTLAQDGSAIAQLYWMALSLIVQGAKVTPFDPEAAHQTVLKARAIAYHEPVNAPEEVQP